MPGRILPANNTARVTPRFCNCLVVDERVVLTVFRGHFPALRSMTYLTRLAAFS